MIIREAKALVPDIYNMRVVSMSPLEMVTEGDAPVHVSEESMIIPSRLYEDMAVGKNYYALAFAFTNFYYILDEE
jgi:hypothetical protein